MDIHTIHAKDWLLIHVIKGGFSRLILDHPREPQHQKRRRRQIIELPPLQSFRRG
jgi:hypothetical protein